MDPEVKVYRDDLIRGAMAAQTPPLTNEALAEKAKLATGTVSAIRNGSANILLSSLVAVAQALEIELGQLFEQRAA